MDDAQNYKSRPLQSPGGVELAPYRINARKKIQGFHWIGFGWASGVAWYYVDHGGKQGRLPHLDEKKI